MSQRARTAVNTLRLGRVINDTASPNFSNDYDCGRNWNAPIDTRRRKIIWVIICKVIQIYILIWRIFIWGRSFFVWEFPNSDEIDLIAKIKNYIYFHMNEIWSYSRKGSKDIASDENVLIGYAIYTHLRLPFVYLGL